VTSTELLLRRAVEQDTDPIVSVYLRARSEAPMPPPVPRSTDHVRRWVARALQGYDEVWVAEVADTVVGFARVGGDWLDDLYVDPAHAGQGVGSALLDLVKSLRPDGFSLWVFEVNDRARRFYGRHGLIELDRTDGTGNEEKAPDIRTVWPGDQPLRFLRGLVDQVDDELGEVLQRRAALTVAIQRYKPVPGTAGRDPDREQVIADRLSRRAPLLGAERLRRIIHTVISESLEAAGERPDDSV
jgi:GNAT superfamily N-acetyltransferase/chorismate mutase